MLAFGCPKTLRLGKGQATAEDKQSSGYMRVLTNAGAVQRCMANRAQHLLFGRKQADPAVVALDKGQSPSR